MIDIIVVEDNPNIQKEIKEIIIKLEMNYKGEIKTHFFNHDKKELNNLINDNTLNKIYILDIELPGSSSGIDIAKKIRMVDLNSYIIMVTTHGNLFEMVYRSLFNISDFIEKINGYQKELLKDLELILNQNLDNRFLVYQNKNINLQINYKHILYIYRDKEERKIYIVTDNNNFSLNIGLVDIEKKLDDRFQKVHRACIVNKNRVENYDWTNSVFTLDNGKQVNLLSKKYRPFLD